MSKFVYSALVLIIGLLFTVFLGGSFGSGSGEITSGIFNSAMSGLIFSIIFLSASIVFSALLILEEIKKAK